MLTVFDPYKALASLPKPLTATEKLELDDVPGPQHVKIIAGLHRQTWISGNLIFVDVHIINKSQRLLKKLELQLQRSVLWYNHAAAASGGENANHLRLPERQNNDIVNSATMKRTKNWKGTLPNTSEIRTCHIQIPQGHVTVSTGRLFEVRYFLNVVLDVALFKTVAVQLPISLIHMNSLDIIPNAVAQVAASIEAKRSKTLAVNPEHTLNQSYHQGQAFVAPQKSSLERSRGKHQHITNAEMEELKQVIDESPRRHRHHHQCSKPIPSKSTRTNLIPRPNPGPWTTCNHREDSDCYHCHLFQMEHEETPQTFTFQIGTKLPRLQVSTSGLGFTESEFSDFDVRDPSPKKVMLSEQERKMILQQRELRHRMEWKQAESRPTASSSRQIAQKSQDRVSAMPNTSNILEQQICRAKQHVLDPRPIRRRSKTAESAFHPKLDPNIQRHPSNTRKRADTEPKRNNLDTIVKDIALSHHTPQLRRLSSKQRGKLRAEEPTLAHKTVGSDALRRTSINKQRNRNVQVDDEPVRE